MRYFFLMVRLSAAFRLFLSIASVWILAVATATTLTFIDIKQKNNQKCRTAFSENC